MSNHGRSIIVTPTVEWGPWAGQATLPAIKGRERAAGVVAPARTVSGLGLD